MSDVPGWERSGTPLVRVVTPVRRAPSHVGETIRSVLAQNAFASGRANLEYVVADGASDDGTVDIARRALGSAGEVVSRADDGMYDALAASWASLGLDAPKAAVVVVAYLNAGDVWEPSAIDTVLDVMEQTGAEWVCGQRALYDLRGRITFTQVPFRYRPALIRAGFYGGSLPHIQQESTFWSGSLMRTVDLDRLRRLRLAGDQYLWSCFATEAEPMIVEAILGGHRVHPGQLSEDRAGYRDEALTICSTPTLAEMALAVGDRIAWELSPRVKKRLNPSHLVRLDHSTGRWV